MSKPKLLVLTSSYPRWRGDYNGNFVHNLNIELTEYFEVFVISPHTKELKKDEVIDGINVHRFKQFFFNVDFAYGTDILVKIKRNIFLIFIIPFFILNQLRLVVKVIKKEKIVLIQAHWIIPQAIVAVLYKILFDRKVKVFGSLLGADLNSFTGLFGKFLKKFILKNLEFTTAQSKPMVESAKQLLSNKKSYYCPIGVDIIDYNPGKLNPDLRQEHNIDGPFLLFTATLIERKGIRYLINALPEILKSHPTVKLVIIGDGILKQEMKLLVERKNISPSVIFLGFKSPAELPAYFASCDIFILPSLSEGFPLVVMYALSSGTITVVSALPVFKELDINDGFLNVTDILNERELASTIIRILDQPSDIIKIEKLQAREYAESNFDIKISANYFASLFLASLYN